MRRAAALQFCKTSYKTVYDYSSRRYAKEQSAMQSHLRLQLSAETSSGHLYSFDRRTASLALWCCERRCRTSAESLRKHGMQEDKRKARQEDLQMH